MLHTGSCHCGALSFEFEAPPVTEGLRCNCSICARKGATMTGFSVSSEQIRIKAKDGALSTYTFGSGVAKHHFCNKCGIYTFHQTLRQPGYYRINIGCIDGVDSSSIPFEVFNGAAIKS
ncbi:GFA family protein [Marinomonas ostreistagni]|uniref:GFA family protein n=1 Tax=Marinomonas ostreistagni TaxID=359209 RepID=A0ABS0ZG89_9GAMM|nr:GFA family protein [Marinomonas ostreistagni]MBJ7552690.1 GFA family protein [Marinomonas ostreistagni]